YGFHLTDVMLISASYGERQRDATPVHQQMSLAAFFFPDPLDWARLPLVPTAPSSWRHRCSASATQSLPSHHIQPGLRAITLRTHQPPATRESVCGSRWHCRSARREAPSTDSLFAGHTQWPQKPSVDPWVCVRRPAYACNADSGHAAFPVARVLLASRTRRSLPTMLRGVLHCSYSYPYTIHIGDQYKALFTDKHLVCGDDEQRDVRDLAAALVQRDQQRQTVVANAGVVDHDHDMLEKGIQRLRQLGQAGQGER